MDQHESRKLVERFWAAMHGNDFRAAGDLLHDEYVIEWPQSSERIRRRENFVAINEHYPVVGRWRVIIHRCVASNDAVATEVMVADDDSAARAITFSELRDGRIARQTEYWPDPFDAAEWRAEWVERME